MILPTAEHMVYWTVQCAACICSVPDPYTGLVCGSLSSDMGYAVILMSRVVVYHLIWATL